MVWRKQQLDVECCEPICEPLIVGQNEAQRTRLRISRCWRKLVKVTGIALGLATLSAILTFYFQPRLVIRWLAARDRRVLYFVNTEDKLVALTIDDGPHPTVTPEILDVLQENGARATFFVIGERIKGNEKILTRMLQEGHEVGNHLMRAYPSILLSPDRFEQELLEVDQMLGQNQVRWCRPGSGWYNNRMLQQMESHGYRCVLGSVYPHDTTVRSTAIISSYVVSQVYPGSIIILHDGTDDRYRTVTVLRNVLPILGEKGYRVVTISQLISGHLEM